MPVLDSAARAAPLAKSRPFGSLSALQGAKAIGRWHNVGDGRRFGGQAGDTVFVVGEGCPNWLLCKVSVPYTTRKV